MGEYSRPPHSSLDGTLSALADPTRRRILDRLSRGDARVTDLAASFPISLNSVSKHIRRLERARLVERQVVGRDHILHMRAEPLKAAAAWITRQTGFWAAQLQALDEHLKHGQGHRVRKRAKS